MDLFVFSTWFTGSLDTNQYDRYRMMDIGVNLKKGFYQSKLSVAVAIVIVLNGVMGFFSLNL